MTARLSAALAVIAILVLAGCSTGKDAVATAGEFQFVAPGGQTSIFYDPPAQRGALHGLSGESLLEPGRMIGPSDVPGQVVVINIWGSWCGPCRTELPELQRVYEQNRTSAVAFLGIDVRDSRDAAGDFVRDRGIAFPSIFDEPGRSLAALHGYPRNTVPSTIVLDRSHRVAAVFLTTVRVAELQPLLSRLAAEPAG